MCQAIFWALGTEFLENTASLGEVGKTRQVNIWYVKWWWCKESEDRECELCIQERMGGVASETPGIVKLLWEFCSRGRQKCVKVVGRECEVK